MACSKKVIKMELDENNFTELDEEGFTLVKGSDRKIYKIIIEKIVKNKK